VVKGNRADREHKKLGDHGAPKSKSCTSHCRRGITVAPESEPTARVQTAQHLCTHGTLLQCPVPEGPDALLRVDQMDGYPALKVLDFGVARVVEGEQSHTATTIGTAIYAAPEQTGLELSRIGEANRVAIAKRVSLATDVWAATRPWLHCADT
jgi:serine/threonine protein kinase